MNIYEHKNILIFAGIQALIVLFFIALKLQRWKTSEEIHLSKFDIIYIKAKYFIYGSILSGLSGYIIGTIG